MSTITVAHLQKLHPGLTLADANILAPQLSELFVGMDYTKADGTTDVCFPPGVYVFTEQVHLHRIAESDYKPSAVTYFATEQAYVNHLATQAEVARQAQ